MREMIKLRQKCCVVVLALMLCATVSFAQNQKQDTPPVDLNAPLPPLNTNQNGGNGSPPIGAARGVSGPDNYQPYDPSQVTPDTNTLAGPSPFTIGSLGQSRNSFDPSLSISVLADDFPAVAGNSSLGASTLLGGGLDIIRNGRRSKFTVRYRGGEAINAGSASLIAGQNSSYYQYHNLTLIQEFYWSRWHLLFRDDFTASPNALFGGQGLGGPGLLGQISSSLGTSTSSLGQSFAPIQTIDTGNAMRYMDSVLGQGEYSLSRSSTLTFSGSYGFLKFGSAGFISSNMTNAQAGYDYNIDPLNSIALLARYGDINYTGTTASTTDYVGALAYGRKITGRLALRAEAGPEEIHSAGAGTGGNFQLLIASVNTGLTYARRRDSYTATYARGLTAGSGVFLGATSDTFSGNARFEFTHLWTGTLHAGYAFNKSLAPAGSTTVNFNNWFFGAGLSRLVDRRVQINFHYGIIDQINPSVCPVSSCGIPGVQQTFGMTVNWHLRPVGLNEP
jgi:hypothetical protein